MLTLQAFEETDSLRHGNRIEIQRKIQYIQTLQAILDSNHIPYPAKKIAYLKKDLAVMPDPQTRPSRRTLISYTFLVCPRDTHPKRLGNPQKL